MKILKNLLLDANHLLFLDFEGTQFSHEVIAVGAVLVDCDENYVPIGEISTFKCYVKASDEIGNLVSTMTGITQAKLDSEGISVKEMLSKLNLFLGNRSTKLKILTYGNQDARMLKTSFKHIESPSDFQKEFVNYLVSNTIDFGLFISKYLRGNKNEYISLIHLREFLNIPQSGESHDPLVDSLDLYHIYQVIVTKKEVLIKAYKVLLKSSNLVPTPLKRLVTDLINGKDVTSKDFNIALEEYFS